MGREKSLKMYIFTLSSTVAFMGLNNSFQFACEFALSILDLVYIPWVQQSILLWKEKNVNLMLVGSIIFY